MTDASCGGMELAGGLLGVSHPLPEEKSQAAQWGILSLHQLFLWPRRKPRVELSSPTRETGLGRGGFCQSHPLLSPYLTLFALLTILLLLWNASPATR